MPANLYCTLAELKQLRGITDADDDAQLEIIIEAISRKIDAECWRRFYSANETRYYTATDSTYLEVDDITTVDTLKTDDDADRTYGTTWQTTDYDLEPYNATLDGEPYTGIRVTPNGNYGFPTVNKGVQIKGNFGYIASGGTVPPEIQAATLLGSNRLATRGQTPLGVSASAALGEINVVIRELRTDPDFTSLIAQYKRLA